MPHSPKPWFRPCRNAWYVEINGRQYLLGQHPKGFPPPRRRSVRGNRRGEGDPPPPILDAFYKFMADRPVLEGSRQPECALEADAAVVTEKFLARCHEHRKPETYEWYRWRRQLFSDALPDRRLPVANLKHFHLDNLLA